MCRKLNLNLIFIFKGQIKQVIASNFLQLQVIVNYLYYPEQSEEYVFFFVDRKYSQEKVVTMLN